jgi:hypothetical protein
LRIEDLNLCADHEELLNAAKRLAEKGLGNDHQGLWAMDSFIEMIAKVP